MASLSKLISVLVGGLLLVVVAATQPGRNGVLRDNGDSSVALAEVLGKLEEKIGSLTEAQPLGKADETALFMSEHAFNQNVAAVWHNAYGDLKDKVTTEKKGLKCANGNANGKAWPAPYVASDGVSKPWTDATCQSGQGCFPSSDTVLNKRECGFFDGVEYFHSDLQCMWRDYPKGDKTTGSTAQTCGSEHGCWVTVCWKN